MPQSLALSAAGRVYPCTMGMRDLLLLFLVFVPFTTMAQPRLGAAPEPGRHSAPAAAPAQGSARLGASPYADTQAERCANLRRELRSARRHEREAGTTGSSDQASARHQDLLAQMQRAGC